MFHVLKSVLWLDKHGKHLSKTNAAALKDFFTTKGPLRNKRFIHQIHHN